jgi:acetylornithine deacetylase/succinyl-diaminopimelate desuccinylase-like protein
MMGAMSMIGDWIESRADEMAELLMRLVAIDTENPPGRGLPECAEVLAEAMARLDLAPEVLDVRAGDGRTGAIVTGHCGDGDAVVYFHGHFDVVPAQSRTQFEPRRAGGRIVGRGTADMKGGLVSMLYGAAAAGDLGLLDGTRIVLHLVCDEETGSTMGSGHLRAAGLIDPSAVAMLTPEPTGGVVWHANRGAITATVTVAGQEAHVGLRQQGDNAFRRLLAVAEPLSAFADELLSEHTELEVEARGSMMVVGGAIGAGANFNVVPGSAWFSVDWRFNPERTLEAELARLHDRIAQAASAADAEVAVEILQQQPAALTPADDPQARRLAACIEAVEGAAPSFELCPGVLDTRWYAQLSRTEAGASRSPMGPASTSRRTRCAGARWSTRCSRPPPECCRCGRRRRASPPRGRARTASPRRGRAW